MSDPVTNGHPLARRTASAPISFGIFGSIRLELSSGELLGTMSGIGFDGTELGPPGFFGPVDSLEREFRRAGLAAVGAYVPLHLAAPQEVFEVDLAQFRASLAELEACGDPDALAILADEGDPGLIAAPFRDDLPRLDAKAWDLAVRRLAVVAELAEERGIGVSFHPHFATYVEKPSEIDRLLATTSLPLCLDTGHLLVGGADPLEYLRRYSGRVNHVHLKDIRLTVLNEARRRGERADGDWWNRLACRLGDGDVDLIGVVTELCYSGYEGWLVIEQDRAPVTETDLPAVRVDQAYNHDWLQARISEHG